MVLYENIINKKCGIMSNNFFERSAFKGLTLSVGQMYMYITQVFQRQCQRNSSVM